MMIWMSWFLFFMVVHGLRSCLCDSTKTFVEKCSCKSTGQRLEIILIGLF